MFKLKSLDQFRTHTGDLAFSLYIPKECVGVQRSKLKEFLGEVVEIDGTRYTIKGVQCFHPAYPIREGEPISIMVYENE